MVMKSMKQNRINGSDLRLPELLFLLLAFLLFHLNRSIPFMMDDLWYSTDLATGGPLGGFTDVVESQIWHFHNWGGRNITHGLLQLVLQGGELFADLLNTLCTLLLAGLICHSARIRLWDHRLSPALPFALGALLLWNPNVKMSMLWESGCVNYVYSTLWILAFLLPYFRMGTENDYRAPRGILLWILPLGLAAGWSNENMGPTCFLLALLCCLMYIGKLSLSCRKADPGSQTVPTSTRKLPTWMIAGALTCLVGCFFCILAPGNFVRVDALPAQSLSELLSQRAFSMLTAAADFLFPAWIFTLVLLVWKLCIRHEQLSRLQCLLLTGIVLSYGAMILSPHYPDRATFGTMVFTIILALTLLQELLPQLVLSRPSPAGRVFPRILLPAAVLVLLVLHIAAIYDRLSFEGVGYLLLEWLPLPEGTALASANLLATCFFVFLLCLILLLPLANGHGISGVCHFAIIALACTPLLSPAYLSTFWMDFLQGDMDLVSESVALPMALPAFLLPLLILLLFLNRRETTDLTPSSRTEALKTLVKEIPGLRSTLIFLCILLIPTLLSCYMGGISIPLIEFLFSWGMGYAIYLLAEHCKISGPLLPLFWLRGIYLAILVLINF